MECAMSPPHRRTARAQDHEPLPCGTARLREEPILRKSVWQPPVLREEPILRSHFGSSPFGLSAIKSALASPPVSGLAQQVRLLPPEKSAQQVRLKVLNSAGADLSHAATAMGFHDGDRPRPLAEAHAGGALAGPPLPVRRRSLLRAQARPSRQKVAERHGPPEQCLRCQDIELGSPCRSSTSGALGEAAPSSPEPGRAARAPRWRRHLQNGDAPARTSAS